MIKYFTKIFILFIICIFISNCTIYHPFSKWEHESTEILKTIVYKNKIYKFGIVKKRKKLFKTKYNKDNIIKKVYENEVLYENCIKYSEDGKIWKTITKKAKWKTAENITPIIFKNQLFVFENSLNYNGNIIKNIWYSKNGKSWKKVNKNIPYESRDNPKYFVFNEKIWLVGGEKKTDKINVNEKFYDIWYSENGINWISINKNMDLFNKINPKIFFVFKNNLYTFSTEKKSIWKSKDGFNWGKYVDTTYFFDSNMEECFVIDDNIWIFGKNEIWQSNNCKEWKLIGGEYNKSFSKEIPNIYFNNKFICLKSEYQEFDISKYQKQLENTEKKYHNTIIYNNKILSIGSNIDDIYISENFMKWDKIKDIDLSSDAWMTRRNKTLILYNNQIWMIGGSRPYGKWKDCWTTSTIYKWDKKSNIFKNEPHNVKNHIIFKNKLWIFDESNNTWMTGEGLLWNKYKNNPYYFGSKIQIFNNHIYLISQKSKNWSIWKSKYGHKWNLVSNNINIIENSGEKKYFYTFNNMLWLINYDSQNKKNNIAWYSNDGIKWNKIIKIPEWWNKITKCHIYKYNEKIWVIGVNKNEKINGQIWNTYDYKKWNKITDIPKLGIIKNINDQNIWFYKNKIWIIDNIVPIDAKNIWILDKDFNSTHIKLYLDE